ncbi:MAG: DinB family protein [Acidobacteriota bacterium]
MSASPASEPYTEPWLRGTHGEIRAAGRAVVHALELALDDIRKWTAGLTQAEIQASPFELTPMATQLRHIAGSIDRILTYAEGQRLTDEQLQRQRSEERDSESLRELLTAVEAAIAGAFVRIRALAAQDLEQSRAVGRKQLPTSLGGALVHVADHTQRHVGQIVVTAKVLKGLRSGV